MINLINSFWDVDVDPFLVSATIEDADPTDIVMVFNEIVTGTNLGFTLSGTTSATFASISGSGTNTITGVLAVAAEFDETILLSYDDGVGDLVDDDTNPVASFTDTAVTNNIINLFLTGLVHAFSLRKIWSNWTRSVMIIRRSSDNTTKHVFFDGNTITLSSFVGDNATTPSGTTLGTWISSDDGSVRIYYAQNENNILGEFIDDGIEPQFITSGVIDTIGSLPAISFNGTTFLKVAGGIPELDSPNALTVVSVSSNTVSAGAGAVWCTTNADTNRLVSYNDRGSSKLIALAQTASGTVEVNLLAQQNSSNQRILTVAIDGSKNMEGWYNGTSQDTETYAGTYTNDYFRIGAQFGNLTRLTGTVQEILIYDVDKTADIAAVHSNINDYYTIY